MPITLVVPNSLQMGWVELPTHFFTVSETGQDVTEQYTETPAEALANHNFVKLTEASPEFVELPKRDISDDPFNYMIEVYMDNYIALDIPRIRYQLHHVSNDVMTGIHDVFPLDKYDDEDAISLKKILKKECVWAVIKNVLEFEFDGNLGEHTIYLTEDRRTNILSKLKKLIR